VALLRSVHDKLWCRLLGNGGRRVAVTRCKQGHARGKFKRWDRALVTGSAQLGGPELLLSVTCGSEVEVMLAQGEAYGMVKKA
jgi:hypothetical protein